MKKVQVLVSTMNQNDHSLLEKMSIQTEAIIVNQCGFDKTEQFYYQGKKIVWINSSTKGLSKSRNIAIANATADYCLIADDDLVYKDKYEEAVIKYFTDNPDVSILRFKVNGIERPLKKYPSQSGRIGRREIMKVSSVEIAFKLKDIKSIRFDELIGAGAKYKMGEENAFLMECYRKNLMIKYVNYTISDLHIGESSWFNGFNESYFFSRGAAIEALKTNLSPLLIIAFAITKYRLYRGNLSFVNAIRMMNKGRKRYIEDSRNDS